MDLTCHLTAQVSRRLETNVTSLKTLTAITVRYAELPFAKGGEGISKLPRRSSPTWPHRRLCCEVEQPLGIELKSVHEACKQEVVAFESEDQREA